MVNIPEVSQSLSPGTRIELFELDVAPLGVVLPEGGTKRYFTNSVANELIGLPVNEPQIMVSRKGGINGTLNGNVVWSKGIVSGWSVELDGVDAYISFGDIQDLTGSFTLEIKVKPIIAESEAEDLSEQRLLTKETGGVGWFLSIGDDTTAHPGAIQFSHTDMPTNSFFTDDDILKNDESAHVAVVFDAPAQTLVLYTNGSIQKTFVDIAAALAGNSADLVLGADSAGTGVFYKGLVDELRIWTVARTQSEIQGAMDTVLTGDESGLSGYWRMNLGYVLDDEGSLDTDGTASDVPLVAGLIGLSCASFPGDNALPVLSIPSANLNAAADFTFETELEPLPPLEGHSLTVISAAQVSELDTFKIRLDATSGVVDGVTVVVKGTAVQWVPADGLVNLADGVGRRLSLRRVSSSGAIELFIDGTSLGTKAAGTGALTVSNIVLGQLQGSLGGGFTTNTSYAGLLDDVRFWSDIRTPSEINDNKDVEMSTPQTGLLGSFKLNDAPGQVLTAILWQGRTYVPIDLDSSGWALSAEGAIPRPKLMVTNVNALFTALVNSFENLVGAKITRTTTWSRYLDSGVDADPNAHYPPEIFFVNRLVSKNRLFIEWELAAILDQIGVDLPSRPILRDICTHTYRREDPDNPGQFTYENVTCPYVGSGSAPLTDGPFFKRDDSTTLVLAEDSCGRRLPSCKKRFPSTPLPTRAFPGVALSRIR